jgi:glycosyl transferase family 25
MESALRELGVSFEFFDAVEGRALCREEIESEYDESAVKRNIDRTLSANEIGCTISHRRIYRKMIEEGIERACILEDDILIDHDFPEILDYLDTADITKTVVKLDNYQEKTTPCSIWGRRKITNRYTYKKPVTTQWMTWGYVIDLAAAQTILSTWPRIAFMSDDWRRMSAVVNIRCVQPAVIHQNTSFDSILDEDRKDLLARTYRPKKGFPKLGRLAHITKTVFKMFFT